LRAAPRAAHARGRLRFFAGRFAARWLTPSRFVRLDERSAARAGSGFDGERAAAPAFDARGAAARLDGFAFAGRRLEADAAAFRPAPEAARFTVDRRGARPGPSLLASSGAGSPSLPPRSIDAEAPNGGTPALSRLGAWAR
jgi:hypothetical protein